MKNKSVWIIGCVVLVLLIILVVLFINKNDDSKKGDDGKKESYNLNEITEFNYYSGSSGYSIRFNGKKAEDLMNVDFVEFSSGDENRKSFTVSVNDFKNLLDNTKVEDCEKHTYEYQCGDNEGCSSSSFSVKFKEDEKVCYVINTDVRNFFENLAEE